MCVSIINRFLTFLANMFSGNSEVSSKRVNGTFCIITTLFILLISAIFGKVISPELTVLVKMVFWGGTALLGLGITENLFK